MQKLSSLFLTLCLHAGGREGVLVVWQLDTGKKKFLPRIGSPLLYFIDSPDPSLSSVSKPVPQESTILLYLALPFEIVLCSLLTILTKGLQISCADNQIHLLKMPSMEILRTISGIKVCTD